MYSVIITKPRTSVLGILTAPHQVLIESMCRSCHDTHPPAKKQNRPHKKNYLGQNDNSVKVKESVSNPIMLIEYRTIIVATCFVRLTDKSLMPREVPRNKIPRK